MSVLFQLNVILQYSFPYQILNNFVQFLLFSIFILQRLPIVRQNWQCQTNVEHDPLVHNATIELWEVTKFEDIAGHGRCEHEKHWYPNDFF